MSVFIAGISSDIGAELARLYRGRSRHVVGTYRNGAHVGSLRDEPQVDLVCCDVSQPDSIRAAADRLKALDRRWDTFVGAIGKLDPIEPLFECDMDQWSASLTLNAAGQLRLLHAIYPL